MPQKSDLTTEQKLARPFDLLKSFGWRLGEALHHIFAHKDSEDNTIHYKINRAPDTLKAITPFRGWKSSSIQDVFQFHTTASLLFIWLMREYDIGIEYIDGLVVMDNKATPRLAIDPGDTR
ncbi:hypothetical protein B0H14DRAFT_3444685 [Mycena olivaceomarginata]|nr:hypothetical protein B0H14DRAFT_3444685 [Mycena olivaceomarginata]